MRFIRSLQLGLTCMLLLVGGLPAPGSATPSRAVVQSVLVESTGEQTKHVVVTAVLFVQPVGPQLTTPKSAVLTSRRFIVTHALLL